MISTRSATVAATVVATALGLALRLWQLSRPGYLFGVTEYDDGVYFGAAVRLVHGAVPYRDFVLVHPPGIMLLLAPIAALTKVVPVADGMAVARVVTVCVSTANIALVGWLLRRHGTLAVAVGAGLLALYPPDLAAAHTVLLEPWTALFCLLGLVVLTGDPTTASQSLARWPRTLAAGVLFGVAGAVKVWAVIPVLVVALWLLWSRRPKACAGFVGAAALGFGVLAAPFAALAPAGFVDDVVLGQLGRQDLGRIPVWSRLANMAGLDGQAWAGPAVIAVVVVILAALVLLAANADRSVGLGRSDGLGVMGAGTVVLAVALFLYPADYYYHYAAFLAPFLALSVGIGAHPIARFRPGAIGVATVCAGVAVALPVSQVIGIANLPPAWSPAAEVAQLIPPGACVVTDQASLDLAANRFLARSPACSPMVDAIGTDYALSGGRNGVTGAGAVPAVRNTWLSALSTADYVWLSPLRDRRVPWTTELRAYFAAHFAPLTGPGAPAGLYARRASER